MKLEKDKNLDEESWFYWAEIQTGTLKFNRIDAEVIDKTLPFSNFFLVISYLRTSMLGFRWLH